MVADKLSPIAVIGVSCKFAQDATSPQEFWQMLCKGRSGLTKIPQNRFNSDAFYHPEHSRTDSISTQYAHFTKGEVEAFDAPFFGISREEASVIDPQQRALLEVTYQALESGGIPIESIAGTKTSVYTASWARDHDTLLTIDPLAQSKYHMMGVTGTMLANRISHFYDLHGPSLALDTACSSSLYALHLACQSLRGDESTTSIVGGSNLILSPETMMQPLSNAGILSREGISYSFDHRANGYSRGEGAAVVVLKRLEKAIEDGNIIRCVIRATGVNHDGRTPSLTAPSTDAQENLIRDTYIAGGLDLRDTQFVEAHGTGTQVGDPIEARIIGRVFRDSRDVKNPLIVGAVKSNIGHLEGASGLAALVKTIMVLECGLIPPNIWYEKPNANIDTEDLRIQFPTKLIAWPTTGLRQASISNFGYGGSNAHLIAQDAFHYLKERQLKGNHKTIECAHLHNSSQHDPPVDTSCQGLTPSRKLILFSTADEDGPRRQAELLQDYLDKNATSSIRFDDLAYTMSEKRSLLPWRAYTIASTIRDLAHELPAQLSRVLRPSQAPQISFIFTGQGAQWHSMGRELLAYPAFRESMQAADRFLCQLGLEWSLLDILYGKEKHSYFDQPALSQPVTTCIQVALIDLLQSWSIFPSSLVGHSSGEIAVAYCAGAVSKHSAWKLSYYRGLCSQRLVDDTQSQPTAMMAVALPESEVSVLMQELNIDALVSIACLNSPNNTTISGVEQKIDVLKQVLDERLIFARKLAVNVAYHSKFVSKICDEYASLIDDIELSPASDGIAEKVTVYSSVTGQKMLARDMSKTKYWTDNLHSRVDFLGALGSLLLDTKSQKNGHAILVEIGPHGALRRPVQEIAAAKLSNGGYTYITALHHKVPADVSALDMAGVLYTHGAKVNVIAINHLDRSEYQPQTLIDLPQYPFRALEFWRESRLFRNYRHRRHGRHELLGTPVFDWNPAQPQWRNIIRTQEMPWVKDHGFNGSAVYPAGGMIVMSIEAVRQLNNPAQQISGYRLKYVNYIKPLILSEDPQGTEVSIILQPHSHPVLPDCPEYDFTIFGWKGEESVKLCRGSIQAEIFTNSNRDITDETSPTGTHRNFMQHCEITRKCVHAVGHDQFYENLENIGFQYGDAFRLLRSISYSKGGQATASINLRNRGMRVPVFDVAQSVIHPTTLDSVLHLPIAAFSEGGWISIPTMVAARTDDIWISSALLNEAALTEMKLSSKTIFRGYREMDCSIVAVDGHTNRPLISIERHRATATGSLKQPILNDQRLKKLAYTIEWKPDLSLMTNAEAQRYFQDHFHGMELDRASIEWAEALAMHFISVAAPSIPTEAFIGKEEYLNRYAEWMRQTLQQPQGRVLSRLHDKEAFEEVLEEDSQNPMLRIVKRVGTNLAEIMRGALNPLELLFNDSLLEECYRASAHKSATYFAAYLDTLSHKDPSLRILEVGAGTGSLAKEVIRVLTYRTGNEEIATRFSEYVFTDISTAFFEKAKPEFAHYSESIRFQKLDIARSPDPQGFKTGSYDVIIAGSVLHATPNLCATLQHCRSLLKPGGKLLVAEQCNMDPIRDRFVFGILPGWWLSEEPYRSDTPLIPKQKWDELLKRSDFSGLDLTFEESEDMDLRNLTAFISTAGEENNELRSDEPAAAIIAEKSSELQWAVAQGLEKVWRQWSDMACDIMSLERSEGYDFDKVLVVCLTELEHDLLNDMPPNIWAIVKAMSLSAKQLLWVTRGAGLRPQRPELAKVTGLARSVCSERGQQAFNTLDLDHASTAKHATGHIFRVLKQLLSVETHELDSEYIDSNGALKIGRCVPDGALNDAIESSMTHRTQVMERIGDHPRQAIRLSIGSPGLLNTLHFVEDRDLVSTLGDDELLIQVVAASLNFKDILVALGQTPGDYLGCDMAGIVKEVGPEAKFQPGEHVVYHGEKTIATYVRCSSTEAHKMSDGLSFEECASKVTVFNTAYYALVTLARLQPGETVLIHSGAGGVGQAAIQIAKARGAEIFVTVGNAMKRDMLIDRYKMSSTHIFHSRDASFVKEVLRETGGRGVDVVLNHLVGELLRRSLECVAPLGRFIEIGKSDIQNNRNLSMAPFEKNITFASVDFGWLVRNSKPTLNKIMSDCMTLMAKDQQAFQPPYPLRIIKASCVEDAFRHIHNGDHCGKTVVRFIADDMVPVNTPTPFSLKPMNDLLQVVPNPEPKYSFAADATYVIAGGLGGLGRSIARWMAARGAKNFLIPSRSDLSTSASAMAFVEELQERQVRVVAPICDVADSRSLQRILEEHQASMPPVKGCIQASMVLKDSLVENMTSEDFQLAVKPKAAGSWNLHRSLPKGLDFFILLSSFAGVVGSRGQSNYAAGNVYQDALARHRVAQGEKCISLNLGLMLGIGYAAETATITKSMRNAGTTGIREDQFLVLLDIVCNPSRPLARPESCQIVVGVDTPESLRSKGHKDLAAWMYKPMFRNLHRVRSAQAKSNAEERNEVNHFTLVQAAGSVEEAEDILTKAFVEKLGRTLSQTQNEIDVTKPAFILGVDSLLAVEVRYWFLKEFHVEVSTFDVLGNSSIQDFCRSIAKRLRGNRTVSS